MYLLFCKSRIVRQVSYPRASARPIKACQSVGHVADITGLGHLSCNCQVLGVGQLLEKLTIPNDGDTNIYLLLDNLTDSSIKDIRRDLIIMVILQVFQNRRRSWQ